MGAMSGIVGTISYRLLNRNANSCSRRATFALQEYRYASSESFLLIVPHRPHRSSPLARLHPPRPRPLPANLTAMPSASGIARGDIMDALNESRPFAVFAYPCPRTGRFFRHIESENVTSSQLGVTYDTCVTDEFALAIDCTSVPLPCPRGYSQRK